MDLNSIKNKLNTLQQQGQKKEKIDYSKFLWKPKQEGKFQIRIVPSKRDKNNPFQEIFIHYGFTKFPIYALTNWGEKDPIVEFSKQLKTSDDKENWKLGKKLEPKMRIFTPVIVRGEEDKGVRLWEFGKEIYMQLLGIADDEDYGDYTDINEGRDFTLDVVTGDVGGRQGLKTSLRIKPKTSHLSSKKEDIEKYLSDQPDLLSIQRKYEFDKLKEILQNFLVPGEESESEIEVDTDDIDSNVEEVTVKETKPAKTDYKLKTSTKKTKADKFDELFEEE